MQYGHARLGLGCWAFGGDFWKDQRQKDSEKTLETAIRRGVEHFDTAPVYGKGRAEQLLGRALKKNLEAKRREEFTVATKGLYHPPAHVEAGIRKSLRRLLSNYIDIYYIHWPKPDIDLRPMIEALEETRKKGLIRFIGLSNFSSEEIRPLMEAGSIDYCQFGYNLLWRKEERDLVPFCLKHGIRPVTYGSLAEGLLTGRDKLPASLPEDDPRRQLILTRKGFVERVEAILEEYFRIAEEKNIRPVHLALLWNLSRRWADTVLFGARSRGQLTENLETVSSAGASLSSLTGEDSHTTGLVHSLDEETERRIDELTADLTKLFPPEENIFGHRPR